jgi:hypothetical protein
MRRAVHILIVAAVGASMVVAVSTSAAAVPPQALSSPARYGGPISYARVMLRGADWLRRDVPYSQDNSRAVWDVDRGRRYRADCSGFVSMAWGLDPRESGLGRAPVTWELPSYAVRIRWSALRGGDILLRLLPANRGLEHVQLFARWVDPSRTRAWVYEESARKHGMRRNLIVNVSAARSGFVPYRYRHIY